MNKPLQISLLLNTALLGCVIFISFTRPSPGPAAAPTAATTSGAPGLPTAAAPIALAPPLASTLPLRWSQLYSSDYHVYVKNLRAIGCPEPSVRAIVTADVDSVYQLIAGRLEQKLAALARTPLANQLRSAGSEQSLREALQKIPAQEEARITDLLGLTPRVATGADQRPGFSNPVPMPLVMQEVDLSSLNFTSEQTQEVASVRQDFLKRTGGVAPGSNDPNGNARWKEAQTEADNMLMIYLGNAAYSQYEVAAHQRMLAQIEAARH